MVGEGSDTAGDVQGGDGQSGELPVRDPRGGGEGEQGAVAAAEQPGGPPVGRQQMYQHLDLAGVDRLARILVGVAVLRGIDGCRTSGGEVVMGDGGEPPADGRGCAGTGGGEGGNDGPVGQQRNLPGGGAPVV